MLAYAIGFGVGIIVGMKIEERIHLNYFYPPFVFSFFA
ncbi:hypothetical protein NT03LS_3231, partial [Listeria seeligeri FSL N1-067]